MWNLFLKKKKPLPVGCEITAFSNASVVSGRQVTCKGPQSSPCHWARPGPSGSSSPVPRAGGDVCPPLHTPGRPASVKRPGRQERQRDRGLTAGAAAALTSPSWAAASPCACGSSSCYRLNMRTAAQAATPCTGETAPSPAENPEASG